MCTLLLMQCHLFKQYGKVVTIHTVLETISSSGFVHFFYILLHVSRLSTRGDIIHIVYNKDSQCLYKDICNSRNSYSSSSEAVARLAWLTPSRSPGLLQQQTTAIEGYIGKLCTVVMMTPADVIMFGTLYLAREAAVATIMPK